jgi:hypothetical protein
MLPHEKEHERQAFKKMTPAKKLEHFLSYYLLQTVIIVAIIVVVLFMIWNAFIKKRDTIIFSAVVFDDIFDYDGLAAMTENLRVLYGVTDPHEIVRIDNNYRSRSTDDRLRLSVVTSAKECDVIVADEPFFRELAGYGYFMDLGKVMTEDEAKALSDRLVKTPGRLETDELIPSDGSGQGEALSYGISLENCEKWQSLKGTMEHPVAGIVDNTERVGASLGFFSWLFDKAS